MDYSTYLRRKRESMTQYVHRKPFLDAGIRTEMLGKQANSVSAPTTEPAARVLPCAAATVGLGGNYVEPIRPANAKLACAICESRSSLYTDPYIVKEGCPIPYEIKTYVSPCKKPCDGPRGHVVCTVPSAVTNLTVFGDELGNETFSFHVTWDLSPTATSYNITYDYPDGTVTLVSQTEGRVDFTATYYIDQNTQQPGTVTINVTAENSCGTSAPVTTTIGTYPCFLAGSYVHMADGSTKVIEDVVVGDLVIGAFGEHNPVLALHRPLLGSATMCKINDEHSTTSHHPHISIDRRFYCMDPEVVRTATYGRGHTVIDADGKEVEMMLHGLRPERILQMETGLSLKTIEGERLVRSLETYTLPPETQLYNLVVGGSHTYHVDGYAVTGWPREDDFDYDTWTAN